MSTPNRAPHHKGQRVRPEELRHRAARLQRAQRRVCPVCGHPVYSRSSVHPQCAVHSEESRS
jgi:hypothetical protein